MPDRQSDETMKILGLDDKAMSIPCQSICTSGSVTPKEKRATPIMGVDPGGGNERQHRVISF